MTADPKPHDVDLRLTIALLWRGRWTTLGVALLFAGAALAILRATPSSYDATAQILLDARGSETVEFGQVVGDFNIDNAIVASEIAVLKSRRLLGAAVDALGLASDPEFGAAPPGWIARARSLAADLAPWAAEALTTPSPTASPRRRAVEALDRAVVASQSGRSYVIAVRVRTGDAAKSARLANALASIYVDDQLAAKFDETARASDWLVTRIDELKRPAADADAAVERYRAEQRVGEGQGQAVAAQQLGEINSQLVAARAARAEADARYQQIRRLIDEQGEGAAANVLSSPLILSLRQQRAEVKRREAELATRYGPKHPKMVNVKAELRDIASAVAVELRKRVAALSNDVEVAAARETALRSALSDLEARSTDFSRAAVGLRQLEREAEASHRILEDVLARHKETSEQRDVQRADARVISQAAPPLRPAAPRRTLIAGLSGVTGALLGLGLVFLGEVMANTFRTGSETQRVLGMPVLAKLPRARAARRRSRLLADVLTRPNSAFAEAARGLRDALALTRLDDPPRVVMVTSAAPGEGKSSTCLALAHLGARAGKRSVLVECDLRRPTLREALGDPPGPDLIDYLGGHATLEQALRPIGGEGAFALPVSRPSPQAADILSSDRFRQLVAELRQRFDLVLLDTPPALAVADATAVARAADATVFLIRWNHTPRQAVSECLGRLAEAGVTLVGVALTLVDPKREAAYEYGGYAAGAPNYAPYYA